MNTIIIIGVIAAMAGIFVFISRSIMSVNGKTFQVFGEGGGYENPSGSSWMEILQTRGPLRMAQLWNYVAEQYPSKRSFRREFHAARRRRLLRGADFESSMVWSIRESNGIR